MFDRRPAADHEGRATDQQHPGHGAGLVIELHRADGAAAAVGVHLARLAPRLPWPSNVWMGVSVESAAYQWRIDFQRRVHQGPFDHGAEGGLEPSR